MSMSMYILPHIYIFRSLWMLFIWPPQLPVGRLAGRPSRLFELLLITWNNKKKKSKQILIWNINWILNINWNSITINSLPQKEYIYVDIVSVGHALQQASGASAHCYCHHPSPHCNQQEKGVEVVLMAQRGASFWPLQSQGMVWESPKCAMDYWSILKKKGRVALRRETSRLPSCGEFYPLLYHRS